MSRILLSAALLSLMATAAGACGMQRSAEAKVDPTVVASTTASPLMSTPATVAPAAKPAEEKLILDEQG